jgi:hypothetical protein
MSWTLFRSPRPLAGHEEAAVTTRVVVFRPAAEHASKRLLNRLDWPKVQCLASAAGGTPCDGDWPDNTVGRNWRVC